MWPLLRVIDGALDEPWARGPGRPPRPRRPRRGGRAAQRAALAVARRLAGLFASYAVQRPALLRRLGGRRLRRRRGRWAACRPGLAAASCGAGWSTRSASRARSAAGTRSSHSCGPGAPDLDLPARRQPLRPHPAQRSEAELLAALGAHRDVHLWLPHPSDAAVAAGRGTQPPAGWRRDDHSHVRVDHPLLAAMARDVREAEAILLAAGAADTDVRRRRPTVPTRCSAGCSATSRPTGVRAATGGGGRRHRPGARVPRSGPPGRGAARGAARPAGRRPDARAARHPGDVPGHRGLRPADQRRLRARRGGAPAATRATTCGSCSPTGPRPRPTRCSASWPGCSTWPTVAPRPAGCSTCSRPTRCGAGSGSATTTWRR